MSDQYIILPWRTNKWADIKKKISAPIDSIIDLDSRISSFLSGRIKPRQITDLFNTMYADYPDMQTYIPQDVFIKNVIPHIQKLVVDGPVTFKKFAPRVLSYNKSQNISFDRVQVATIIACIWFGILNYNYISAGALTIDTFPEATFSYIFSSKNVFALQCVVNYFYRIYQYMNHKDENTRNLFAAGNIIIKKNILREISWEDSAALICNIKCEQGKADDSIAKIHLVSSSEYIGADMFEKTITSEEIVLLTRPECLLAVLLCPKLVDNEAIVVFGAEKMSQYTGYGTNVRFVSNHVEQVKFGYNTDQTEVLAQIANVFIDASPKISSSAQFINDFLRDLDKVYCGLDACNINKQAIVATSHWSYKFNGNNIHIKFLQIVLAASQSNKSLIYFPLDDNMRDTVNSFADWIANNKITVSELMSLYLNIINNIDRNQRLTDIDIIDHIMQEF